MNFSIKLEGNLKQSSPTDIILSTNPGSPTTISTNVYYRTTQQQDTYYISVYLTQNEFYIIHIHYAFMELYFYNDSSFSNEIKYINDQQIMFAPSTTKIYYIKWIKSSSSDRNIGVWKANKYTTTDITAGISIAYNDADWGCAAIFFTSPKIDDSWDEMDIDVELTGSYDYHTISNSSDEAYNSKEISSNRLRLAILNNPETGFLIQFYDQGLFKITTPQPPQPAPPPDWELINTVIIIVGSIIGTIVLIYANNKYWKIGHRIQKRRREKTEIRELKKRQISDYSQAGSRIDEVVDGWKKSDKKENK